MQWTGFIDAHMFSFTVPFEQVKLSDIALVGGKDASLGELTQSLAGDDVAHSSTNCCVRSAVG